MTKLLLIRRDNIGDLVCTTPLISALRRALPEARIDVLVNSYCADVLRGNPDIDNLLVYTKAKHRRDDETVFGVYARRAMLTLGLRLARYDWIVLANVSCLPRPLRWARLAGGKRVIGFSEPGVAAPVLTDPVPLDRSRVCHEVEHLMALMRPFGVPAEIPSLRVFADPALAAADRERIAAACGGTAGPLVAINVSARKPSQQWPTQRFVELIALLRQRLHATSLLFWAPGSAANRQHPGDDEKAAEIVAACAAGTVVPITSRALAELIAGVSCADLMVTPDGGAMHIGAACGKPVVALFGDTEARQWYPWGVPQRSLQPPSRDVADIGAAEVAAACIELLQEAGRR